MSRDGVQSRWIQEEVLSGGQSPLSGHGANAATHDLAGSNAEATIVAPPVSPFVLRVESTSSTATLQGVTFNANQAPYDGQILILMGASGDPTNAVTVEDQNGAATDPFYLGYSVNATVDEQEDFIVLVYDSGIGGWVETSRRSDPPVGHPANPDTHDLAGSNGVATLAGPPQRTYVLRVDSTTSTANLQGATASNAKVGDILIVMGASGNPANAVTITDNEAVANAFQTSGGTSNTVDAATDIFVHVFDGTDWAEIGEGAGN